MTWSKHVFSNNKIRSKARKTRKARKTIKPENESKISLKQGGFDRGILKERSKNKQANKGAK